LACRQLTRRPANPKERGPKLVIHESTQGGVCLLPGTELAFDDDVRYHRAFNLFGKARVNQLAFGRSIWTIRTFSTTRWNSQMGKF
jgi:hypothetical protein